MKFIEMSLEHFGPFRAQQKIPLADLGLVLVRGRNMVSAAADDNGAGKTSLFSALSWVLYGETLPGPDGKVQRADDVACRFTKDPCIVMLHGSHGEDDEWAISRSRRPPGLWQQRGSNEVAASQEWIDGLIGFGSLTFRNAVVLGQGAVDRLATADQGAYLKMLDEIQGLSFKDALERAKAWREEWTRKLGDLASAESNRASLIYQAQQQIADLERGLADFRDGKADRVKAAELVEAQAHADVSAAMIAMEAAKPSAARAAKLRERWERVKELQAALTQQADAVRDTLYARDSAAEKLSERDAELKALLHAKRCPTCRRAVAGQAAVAEVTRLFQPDVAAEKAKVKVAEKALAEARVAMQNAQVVLDRHLSILPDGTTERTVAAAEAAGGAAEVERCRKLLEQAYNRETTARNAVEAERKRTWEGQPALDAAREQVMALVAERDADAAKKERATRTLAAAEYWVEAFGDRGLRSLLFDSVADFLNDRLAHHLSILAAGEADVTVSALTALKKGAVKERMSVTASWGWGAGSYGAGSAGQGGRVNLALVAAHQDLAESRSARPFPLRVFDEPECHVDPRGQEILARWIRAEAARRGTTFLVTHNPLLAELVEPDRTFTIVLDNAGARVEVA